MIGGCFAVEKCYLGLEGALLLRCVIWDWRVFCCWREFSC